LDRRLAVTILVLAEVERSIKIVMERKHNNFL
jgi:hypothetical protein